MTVPSARPKPKLVKRSASGSRVQGGNAIPARGMATYNPMPIIGLGLLLSVAWIVGCLVLGASVAGGLASLAQFGVAEWAMTTTGICLPLFLAWTSILGIVQHRSLRAAMMAELTTQMQTNSMHQGASASQTGGADIARHMNAISDELEGRLQSFHRMTDELSSVLIGLTSQMESQNRQVDDMSARVSERSQDIAKALSSQTQQIDAAEQRVQQLVDRVSGATTSLTELSQDLKDQVEAPIVAVGTNLRSTVLDMETQIGQLETRMTELSKVHQTTADVTHQAHQRLANEAQNLGLASEAAVANIDTLSMKLADQIKNLDGIGLKAAQQIASVQEDFTSQARDLAEVTNRLGEHVVTIAHAIDTQNGQLATLGKAANDYGDAVAAQVRENSGILAFEADQTMQRLQDHMTHQLAAMGESVDAKASFIEGTARRLEKRLEGTLEKGSDLLDAITAINNDSVTQLDAALVDTLAQFKLRTNDTIVALNKDIIALSRDEAERLDAVKERVAATLASLQESCDNNIFELSARATATANLLDTQTGALQQRLEAVSETSQELHERLSSAAQALGRELTLALDETLRAHAKDAGGGVHVIRETLDQALAQWQQALQSGLGQAQDDSRQLVASTAESLKHLTEESVTAISQAGMELPELAEGIVQAASSARAHVNEVQADLSSTLARVIQTVDDTSHATQLMQRDLAQAPARLDAATTAFGKMTQAISESAQSVEVHANDIEARSDTVMAQLTTYTNALQNAGVVTDQVLTDQSQRLEQGASNVVALTQNFATDILAAAQQAKGDLTALTQLSTDDLGAIHQTSAKVGAQIEDFARQAADLKMLLNSIGGLATEHGMALQMVGEQAESRTQRFMSLVKDDERDAFLRSAESLVDRLQGLAIDVDSILDGDVDPAVLAAYQSGDHGVAVRKLLASSKSNHAMARVAQRHSTDPKFRERLDLYVQAFDDLLSRAHRADPSKLLHTTFLTADIGKLYVFLTQSLGLLAAAE